MNKRCVGGTLAVAFLGATLAAAQITPTPTPYYPPPAATPTPYYPPSTAQYPQYPLATTDTTAKNPLLLALVIQPILQQGGAALASGVGMLFSRLFAALSGHGSSATAPQPGVPGAYAGMPMPPGYPGAPTPYGTPGATPTPYGTPPPTYPSAPAPYGTAGTYGSTPTSPSVPSYGAPGYATPAAATYPAVPTTGAAGASPSAPGTATTPPAGKAVVLPSVVLSLIQLDPHSYATARRIDL